MRNVVLLSCGLALAQLLACGSDDKGSQGGVGGAPGAGGSSASTTEENGGGTVDSDASGGTTASTSDATTNASGGKTSTTAKTGAGGNTNPASTTANASGGGTSDTSLTPNSPLAGKLTINELCPSNKTGTMEGGSYPDWIELHNASAESISLKGFYISDDNADLTKFPLAKDTLVVPAGGVLILWADGDADETDFHLGFSLSAGGETVTLLDADQKVIDSVTWANAESDKAYARMPDGTGDFAWCSKGTPNRANGSACP